MSLDDMDKSGIQTSLLSLIQPAIAIGDVALGRTLAREANEYSTKVAGDHKGRFGSFAALPYTDTSRFQREETTIKGIKEKLPNGFRHELSKFYYDMAQGNHPGALDALLHIAPVSQFLYGTDYPFRTGAEVNEGLAKYQRFTAAERRAIDRDNALRILPTLNRG